VLVVAIFGWLYVAHALGVPGLGAQVLVLFPLLVVALAYGDGPVHRFLGSGPLVLGGGVSFALYLVHVPLIKLFRDVHAHTDLVPLSYEHRTYGELGVALLSLVIAYLLFRHVEEPARRRMRAMRSPWSRNRAGAEVSTRSLAGARVAAQPPNTQDSGLRSAALRR
jgi:peptidoglycan/LPS O-acetylase OafA/YrhL